MLFFSVHGTCQHDDLFTATIRVGETVEFYENFAVLGVQGADGILLEFFLDGVPIGVFDPGEWFVNAHGDRQRLIHFVYLVRCYADERAMMVDVARHTNSLDDTIDEERDTDEDEDEEPEEEMGEDPEHAVHRLFDRLSPQPSGFRHALDGFMLVRRRN